jgi:DNA-binding NarL/FixJ family response regulator
MDEGATTSAARPIASLGQDFTLSPTARHARVSEPHHQGLLGLVDGEQGAVADDGGEQQQNGHLLRLIDQNHVDAVLADSPPREQLANWRNGHADTAFVVLIDGYNDEDSLDALHAGARGILPRSAERNEIAVAVKAVTNGLAVLPRELLPTLLNGGSEADELLDSNDAVRTRLTHR